MIKVRYLLLFLVLSNTFSLQQMTFTRALYQQPQKITEEKLSPTNASKQKAMSDIIENMMELISLKFRTGKRNTDQLGPPDSDIEKIENLMKLINMKFRTGKRNIRGSDENQQAMDIDIKKFENIMKLINMKFRTGKRNIRDGEENFLKEREENEMKLTELRDNMAKRSFSSLRIRHDGRYIYYIFILHYTSFHNF